MVTAACLAHHDAFDDPSSPGSSKGTSLNPRVSRSSDERRRPSGVFDIPLKNP
jgi:hypothetical protein